MPKSNGKVQLLGFYQGSQLWNIVTVTKVHFDQEGNIRELDETENLPHRPDAFFALYYPEREDEEKTQYSFYEADRKTTSVKKMHKKLRAHFHYIVKQRLTAEHYGVKRIRAVLIESTEEDWTNTLRESARHPVVSGSKLSPLLVHAEQLDF